MFESVPTRITLDKLEAGKRNVLGPALKSIRLAKKLTQSSVLVQLQRGGLDISKQVLIYIERGSRTLSDVELFAMLKVLGATPSDLESEFRKFCRK